MEKLHKNKRILDKEVLVLREKGWVGGKTKATWGHMKWTTLGKKPRGDLANVEMIGSTWREKHASWKGLTWQSQLSWRISIHIELWEHRLGKVCDQHLTSRQLEYHNSKQNKGLACRISQNKHMIEISFEVSVVGPTRARVYSTIMYKAVHMT